MIEFVEDAKEFVKPLWELVQKVASEKSYTVYFSIDKVASRYRVMYSIDGRHQYRQDLRCSADALRTYSVIALLNMLKSIIAGKQDVTMWISTISRGDRIKCTLTLLEDFKVDIYIPSPQSRKHRIIEVRRLSNRELLSDEEMDMHTFAQWIYGALLLAHEAKTASSCD